MTSSRHAVVVIGSGPAGVIAARALLDAGLEVLMIEAGDWPSPKPVRGGWTEFRARVADQQAILGYDAVVGRSPKFSVPWVADLVARAAERLAFKANFFAGTPIAAVGGLSVAWGAGLGIFDSRDLADWPISAESLVTSYRAVAEIIGLSGHWPAELVDQPSSLRAHPGLHPNAMRLLKRATTGGDFSVWPGLNAVLGRDQDGRQACDLGGACLFGCAREAVWSASHEVRNLQKSQRFNLLTNTRVEMLEHRTGFWRLICERGLNLEARFVVCAAGAIGSPKLIYPIIGLREGRLLSSPAAAFALLLPERLGAPWESRFFGLTQLQARQNLIEQDDYVFANIFCGEGIPIRSLASMAPVAPLTAMRLFRDLVPAMMFGNCFFDGRYSRHFLTVNSDRSVTVAGGHNESFRPALRNASKKLRRSFSKLGAHMLPPSLIAAEPGSDLHFAGSLPMSGRAVIGSTDEWGRPYGLENLIVVDGSTLPSLPAKGHTYTIMANAYRLAKKWGAVWTT